MAFCKYCGTKLEEGQLCNCEAAVAERAAAAPSATPVAPVEQAAPAPAPQAAPVQQPQAQPVQQAAPVQQGQPVQYQGQVQVQGQYQQAQPVVTIDTARFQASATKSFSNILAVLKAPVSGGANYITTQNTLGTVLLLFVQALLTSIFALSLCARYNSALDGLRSELGMFGGLITEEFEASLVAGFFLTFLFVIITMAAYAGAFFLGGIILKLDFNFLNVLDFMGYRALFTIPVTVFAIVFGLINVGAGMLFFYMAGFVIFAMMIAVMVDRFAFKKNAVLYMSIIVIMVVSLILAFVYSKVFMLYVPGIKEIFG